MKAKVVSARPIDIVQQYETMKLVHKEMMMVKTKRGKMTFDQKEMQAIRQPQMQEQAYVCA